MTDFRTEPVALSDPRHACDLLALLDHYACDPMGGGEPLSTEVRATLVGRLQGWPGYRGFLVYHGEQAVGLVNCFLGFSTFKAQALLNIHDVVVKEAWRGRGVAQRLLAAVETLARAEGCCKLTLEVLSNNQAAQRSYARFGFAPYVLDPTAGNAQLLQKWLTRQA